MTVHSHISKAKLKFARSLTQKKIRVRESAFVVEGWRAVEEACRAGVKAEMFLFTEDAAQNTRQSAVFHLAIGSAREVCEVTDSELEAVTETVTAQGVALVLPQFRHSLEGVLGSLRDDVPHTVIALDRISEPGNAGTIIRTADWFGADMVVLSEDCVDLYNPKLIRSTMGSVFHVPVVECAKEEEKRSFTHALQTCREAGFTIFGAEVGAPTDLRSIRWARRSVIVIGSEAHGVSDGTKQEISECFAIPRFGRAESLNAGTAAAVILGVKGLL